jgi:hypothetical protein
VNSLALTDGLLLLVTVFLVSRGTIPLAFRMGCAVLAAAAALGVLRFSGLLPLPQMHSFFSAMGASSAFWLLAASVIWPKNSVSVDAKYASILLIVSAGLGLIMVDWLGIAIFGQLMAVTAVICILVYALRARAVITLLGALALETGFVLFATRQQIPGLLQPGDFLHIFTAAGLLALSRTHLTAAEMSHTAG